MYLPSQTSCHYHPLPTPPKKNVVVPLFKQWPQPNVLPILFLLFDQEGNATKIDYIHVPALPRCSKIQNTLGMRLFATVLGKVGLVTLLPIRTP